MRGKMGIQYGVGAASKLYQQNQPYRNLATERRRTSSIGITTEELPALIKSPVIQCEAAHELVLPPRSMLMLINYGSPRAAESINIH